MKYFSHVQLKYLFTVLSSSAGVGRTGMVIAMEAAMHKMEAVEPVYPLELVRIMRDQRGMMVPSLVRLCVRTCVCVRTACVCVCVHAYVCGRV